MTDREADFIVEHTTVRAALDWLREAPDAERAAASRAVVREIARKLPILGYSAPPHVHEYDIAATMGYMGCECGATIYVGAA